MKLLFLILVFLLNIQFSHSQNPTNGVFKDYYESGALKTEGQFKYGKRIGQWKSFHNNGQISRLYSYNEGKRNKTYRSYYKDGTLKSKTEKVDGEYLGTGYYENGALKYTRELETGYYKDYFESGAIKTEANYFEYDLVGQWKRYYLNGQLEWLVTYKKGYREGLYKQYYESGDIKLEGSNTKDKVDGEEKRYLENNILHWVGAYKKGLLNGKWTKFNNDSTISTVLKYKKGIVSKSDSNVALTPTKVAEGVTDIIPIYPGCENALTNKTRRNCMSKSISTFIFKNFNTDLSKGLSSGKKRIVVDFKLDKKGIVEVVRVTGPNHALKLEAYEIIKRLPKIKPAIQNGKPVIFPFSIPIVFQVK